MKRAFALAGGFIVLALLWWTFAIPALVEYPTNLDVMPRYTGTFTLFVNPATATPSATPTQLPLSIDRHIAVLGRESGSSRVVVRETITQKAGDLVNATQTNVYVMDRRTLKNVADPRAYAFEPSNVVDRSGVYRLNLAFDTSSAKTYRIYKNEIGTNYVMRGDTVTPTTDEAGLRLRNFTASVTDVPLDAAYLAQLNKVEPLPASMTLDQLKPQLKGAGLDVDAVLAALAPTITPADLSTLGQLAAKPIPLQYVLSFDGKAAVEPMTGAEVDVAATESVGARPVLADVASLQAVLGHYPNVPEAVAAGRALSALSTAPATKLFAYRYQQTPASVVSIAHKVGSMRSQIRLAKVYVPFGLLGAGTAMLLVGGWLLWRRGPRPSIDLREAPPTAGPEPVPLGVGSER